MIDTSLYSQHPLKIARAVRAEVPPILVDPVPLLGSGGGLGKGVVAGRQDGDKEVGLLLVAGIVQPGDGQPGPVDEGLFPGFVGVPQDDVDGLLPAAVVL